MATSKLKTIITVKSIVTFVFGVALVLFPAPVFSLFGIVFNPGGILVTRLYGAALIIFGLQLYFSRNAPVLKEDRPGLLATCLGDIVAVIATGSAQIAGVMNSLGWLLVITYILSASLFGYLSFAAAQGDRQ
jgi:hypothetical protein